MDFLIEIYDIWPLVSPQGPREQGKKTKVPLHPLCKLLTQQIWLDFVQW